MLWHGQEDCRRTEAVLQERWLPRFGRSAEEK
ncbi:hypothetical protein L914_07807 [Phytophthora nicotianae]|uniref:Uncharacterized protein n=1 Tax=Phytophthora nicotianae TaxID=4792 RepID=W2NG27_PHYNI|nr:hypothetical protein L914_07807 [Phytophthora nicotianae]